MKNILALLLTVAISCPLAAQQSDPFAPAEKLADGWEQIDQRLIFLMVRLADIEANLDAVDVASRRPSGGLLAAQRFVLSEVTIAWIAKQVVQFVGTNSMDALRRSSFTIRQRITHITLQPPSAIGEETSYDGNRVKHGSVR